MLAHNPVNFALLTDYFHFQNYRNFDLECKHGKHKTVLRAAKITGTFEKRAPEGLKKALKSFLFKTATELSDSTLPGPRLDPQSAG